MFLVYLEPLTGIKIYQKKETVGKTENVFSISRTTNRNQNLSNQNIAVFIKRALKISKM